METNPLRTYERRDVSANTSLRVGANRTRRRIGTLVHTTSGTNSLDWLQGGSLQVGKPASADYLITRGGVQYALTANGRYAYHAGISELVVPDFMPEHGRYKNLDVSQLLIGIELEALVTQGITLEQYDSLADVIVQEAVINKWRWPFYILGHYAVARPLGRRADPVNFDWGGFMGRLWIRSKQQAIGGT